MKNTKLMCLVVASIFLASCQPEQLPVERKYHAGQKVLLKTGDQAVIIGMPWLDRKTYSKGTTQPNQRYVVRIGFVKRISKTESLLGGRRTVVTDITKFTIWEFEIEKEID